MIKKLRYASKGIISVILLAALLGGSIMAQDSSGKISGASGIMPAALTDEPGPEGSDIDLRNTFVIPSSSNAYVHQTNKNQVVITDTNGTSGKVGQLWFNYKLDMTNDFEVESKIYLGENAQGTDRGASSTKGGNGLTFTMHRDSRNQNAVGSTGQGLGIGTDAATSTSNKIANGIALEFDTHLNYYSDTAIDGGANYSDADVVESYSDITGRALSSGTTFAAQSAPRSLLHIGFQKTPLKANTRYATSTAGTNYKRRGHASMSIFTMDYMSEIAMVKRNSYQIDDEILRKVYANPNYNTYTEDERWSTTVYTSLLESDIYKRWHDLKITWDKDTLTLKYEVGDPDSKFYAADEYYFENEADLRSTFGLGNTEKIEVYWGYTGATGNTYKNFQSVAVKKLPSFVKAEAVKKARRIEESEYKSTPLKASAGETAEYVSTIKVNSSESYVPLADIHFGDELEGMELTGSVKLERINAAGNVTETRTLQASAFDRSGDPDAYTGTALKGFLSDKGKMDIYGVGTIGEGSNQTLIDESMRITYQAKIKKESAGKMINDTKSKFYSGTADAVVSDTSVPIEVRPDIKITKSADKDKVYIGSLISYKIEVQNKDAEDKWEGRLEDKLPKEVELPSGYSPEDIKVTGTAAEIDKIMIKIDGNTISADQVSLGGGEKIEIEFLVKMATGKTGEKIVNTADVTGGYVKSSSVTDKGSASAEVIVLGERQNPVIRASVLNQTGLSAEEEREVVTGGPTYVLDRLKYEVHVKNPNLGTAWKKYRVEITLPKCSEYTAGSYLAEETGIIGSGEYKEASHSIVYEADAAPRGAEVTIAFEVMLGRDGDITTDFQAEVEVAGIEEDNPSEDILETVKVNPPDEFGDTTPQNGEVRYREPDVHMNFVAKNLSLEERMEEAVRVGDVVEYTYTVENKGGAASKWIDAETIIGSIPAGLELLENTLQYQEPGKAPQLLNDNEVVNGITKVITLDRRTIWGDEGVHRLTFQAEITEAGEGKKKENLGVTARALGGYMVYKFEQGTHTSIETIKGTEKTAYLEEMKEGDVVQEQKPVFALYVPNRINLGEQEISTKTKRSKITTEMMSFVPEAADEEKCIGVRDTRKVKYDWELRATLSKGFKDESGENKLNDVLVYFDGNIDRPLSETSVEVAVQPNKTDSFINISEKWDDDAEEEEAGLYMVLKPNQGALKERKYSAEIYWELLLVP